MQIRITSLYAILLSLLSASQLSGSTEAHRQYEMSGFCQINGIWMISLLNHENDSRLWLREGQRLGELHFESFDAETQTAMLSCRSAPLSIKLKDAEDAQSVVPGSSLYIHYKPNAVSNGSINGEATSMNDREADRLVKSVIQRSQARQTRKALVAESSSLIQSVIKSDDSSTDPIYLNSTQTAESAILATNQTTLEVIVPLNYDPRIVTPVETQ